MANRLRYDTKHKQINWTSSKLKFCASEGHFQEGEKIAHTIGENVYKSYLGIMV